MLKLKMSNSGKTRASMYTQLSLQYVATDGRALYFMKIKLEFQNIYTSI